MEEFKQFLIQNWQLLASACLFIMATIIGIIRMKRKGCNFSDIVSGLLVEQLPIWISMAEASKKGGEQKRVEVLNQAINFAAKKLGRSLTQEEIDYVIAYATEKIEAILATPQKHQTETSVLKRRK